jgi:hypothetical protein
VLEEWEEGGGQGCIFGFPDMNIIMGQLFAYFGIASIYKLSRNALLGDHSAQFNMRKMIDIWGEDCDEKGSFPGFPTIAGIGIRRMCLNLIWRTCWFAWMIYCILSRRMIMKTASIGSPRIMAALEIWRPTPGVVLELSFE